MHRENSVRTLRDLSRLLFLLVCLSALLALIDVSETVVVAQRKRGPSPVRKPTIDYKNFSHITHVSTQKLGCKDCHAFPSKNWKEVRKADDAFQDVAEFPEHSACLNCHRTQFYARERPAPSICANCHVAVTPRDTTRFLFPSLGDVKNDTPPRRDFISEFAVNFPHETHLDVVASQSNLYRPFLAVSFSQQKKEPPANCPVCHQTYQPQGDSSQEYFTKPPKNLGDAFWIKKGTFKTIPNSHTSCFTCHNAESGIAPVSSDCQGCHKLMNPSTLLARDFDPTFLTTMGVTDQVVVNAWRRRISAGAYRHEGGAHPDLPCSDCHHASQMNTVEARTLKVAVRSCGGDGCHITATSDEGGSLNFELDQRKSNNGFVCTKCHITFGKQPVPPDHPQAIPKSTPAKKPDELRKTALVDLR